MSTGRRLLMAIAVAGATAGALPSGASAQGPVPGCTFPHAWTDAPVAAQYELDLFLTQTQFDLARVSPATTSAFASATVRRATALTTALAGITTGVVTAGISQPPACR